MHPQDVEGVWRVVVEFLVQVHVVLLAAAVPLTVVAAAGTRDAPWGDVVRPLPGVAVLFLAAAVVEAVTPSTPGSAAAMGVLMAGGAVGVVWMVFESRRLFGGERTL